MENVKHVIKIAIRANSAESGPPLGTVLGNIGVNAIKFAKDFNEYTIEIPNFYKVNVIIYIFRNNSYNFIVKFPSIGALLGLLRKDNYYGGYFFQFSDLLKLALLKFPKIPLKSSIKIVIGSAQSCNNTVISYSK
jgi:hypothetical protein